MTNLRSRRAPDPSWACRWCGSETGRVVLDLGEQPAADLFPRATDPAPDPVHSLAMVCCNDCRLAQLEYDPTTPDEPRGIEPAALVAQAADAIERISAAGLLPPGARVLEHPSPHGGSWIPALSGLGLRSVDHGPAEVVVDAFGMMHDADQHAALRTRAEQLAEGGVLLLQFHSLAAILRQGMWNALRHGHFAYYSVPILLEMAGQFGLVAVGAWQFDLYGGTVMLAFQKDGQPAPEVERIALEELAAGVTDPETVAQLQNSVGSSVDAIREYLDSRPAGGRVIAGYGAASRSVALLRMASVERDQLVGVADASPTKIGRLLPGVRIPIIAPSSLIELRPARVLLFVPDLLDEVRKNLPEVEQGGGRWVVLEPRPVEIEPKNEAVASPRRQ